MEKIYQMLPWVKMSQAVDWLRRLTGSTLEESDLLSLCEAGLCDIYVNVGSSKAGTDEDSWLLDVIASGYHRIRNPQVLALQVVGQDLAMELHGKVVWFTSDDQVKQGEINWFTSFDPNEVSTLFKSPDIKALAEKLNADELSANANELELLRKSAEDDRLAKQAALLRAQEAEAESSALRTQVMLAEERASAYRNIAKDLRSGEQLLTQQLNAECKARQLSETAVSDLRQSADFDAEVSPRERASYERIIYVLAREAGYKLTKPHADENLIIAQATLLGAKIPTGKGVIARKLKDASDRFNKDLNETAESDLITNPIRDLADPIRA